MTPTDPAILCFGTPVVLISTLNEDSTPNLAPMSSAWWLGHRCMLGLAAGSKTTENLLRGRVRAQPALGPGDFWPGPTGSTPTPGGR